MLHDCNVANNIKLSISDSIDQRRQHKSTLYYYGIGEYWEEDTPHMVYRLDQGSKERGGEVGHCC